MGNEVSCESCHISCADFVWTGSSTLARPRSFCLTCGKTDEEQTWAHVSDVIRRQVVYDMKAASVPNALIVAYDECTVFCKCGAMIRQGVDICVFCDTPRGKHA